MTIDIPYPEINTDGRAISTEQINEYLYKLAQSLEFSLSDISLDNLSKELLDMIGVGVNEETVKQYAEDALRSANSFSRRIVNDAVKSMKEYTDETVKAGGNTESPVFTGVPTAPTAAPGTNTDQIATTAFVANAIKDLGGGSGGYVYAFSVNFETGQLEYEREE